MEAREREEVRHGKRRGRERNTDKMERGEREKRGGGRKREGVRRRDRERRKA